MGFLDELGSRTDWIPIKIPNNHNRLPVDSEPEEVKLDFFHHKRVDWFLLDEAKHKINDETSGKIF
jgi:hypothetical protein